MNIGAGKRFLAATILAAMPLVGAGCHPKPKADAADLIPPPSSRDTTISVATALGSPDLVGWTVRLDGRCLGYGSLKAEGPPPRTRSDWQLEDGPGAIWVTGPLPSGCDALKGSVKRSTVQATLAQDTISLLGMKQPKTRRFLVVH